MKTMKTACGITNFVQVIHQTYNEKFEMYMKIDKETLIKMLLENQRLLEITTHGHS